MNLIIIEEIDKDEKSTIIGVAENMQYAKEMLHDYNGKYKLLGVEDVRESGIEKRLIKRLELLTGKKHTE